MTIGYTITFIILFGVIGSMLGSMTGCFVDRFKIGDLKNFFFGGESYCMSCKHKLHSIDLFPIFSYLLLKGKCRYCGAKIPNEVFLYETAGGVIGLLIGVFLFL